MAWSDRCNLGVRGGREGIVFLTAMPPLYTSIGLIDRGAPWFCPACILLVWFGRMRAHWPTMMKSYREELWFETKTRRAYLKITQQVEAAVRKRGVQEGLVLVNAMHITASVYINDDEPGLLKDYDRFLEELVPQGATYRHNETGEDNGDAHIKRQVMGREVVVAITGGRLDFGPWEQIFYGEFDGMRRKRVLVKVIGA